MPVKVLIAVLSAALLNSTQMLAQEAIQDDLSIGRMRVMIWPEYDDRSVLVVHDGRFDDDTKFPAVTDFLIPKDAIVNDICSLSPGGQHFCQLYDLIEGDDYDKVRMSLPFSNFYLSFHYNLIDVDTAQKNLEYIIKANHPIASMEVDVQQPLGSSEFAISPAGGKASVIKDFNHFRYSLRDIAMGDQRVFKIDYVKQATEPSVDVKFASMTGNRVWGSPYQTQRNVLKIVYFIFASGVLMIAGAGIWLMKTRGKKKVT